MDLMEHRLNLVENGPAQQEKRIFPRFPFPAMTFKLKGFSAAFQVANISPTGMGIQLKNGSHQLQNGDLIEGLIHWQGKEFRIKAKVAWSKSNCAGLSLRGREKMAHFFSEKNIIQGLKALHLCPLEEDRPANLKYWLKSASLLEVFVWAHGDGEYQKIQILFIDNFIEWCDGQGLQTGKLLSQQDRDTPLFGQDELMIEMDHNIDPQKIAPIGPLLQKIPQEKIEQSTKEFILLKLNAA